MPVTINGSTGITDADGGTVLSTADFASQAQAVAGTDNTTIVTPLRVRDALNASGSAPTYACRAWVNFNGSNGAIRGSGNVSSVTYNGTGQSTVNFTTAMQDTNYSAVCSGHSAGFTRQSIAMPSYLGYATGSIVILYGNTINGAAENLSHVNVAVFR